MGSVCCEGIGLRPACFRSVSLKINTFVILFGFAINTKIYCTFQVPAKSSDMGKSQRQKKPKDAKPKVKKLKYHQYIPPDQKADRSPVAMDAAYSRLLQQQQIFLQLQILNQQQNQTFCVQTVHPLATRYNIDQRSAVRISLI